MDVDRRNYSRDYCFPICCRKTMAGCCSSVMKRKAAYNLVSDSAMNRSPI
jgi:hypothetical protein